MKRVKKVINIILTSLFSLVLLLTAICGISTLVNGRTSFFTFQLVEVQSSSMRASGINVGDIYIINPKKDYKIGDGSTVQGDVIAFKYNGIVWFHEIVGYNEETNGYITKGSSNNFIDGTIGVTKENIIGAKCSNVNLRILNEKTFTIFSLCAVYILILIFIGDALINLIDECFKEQAEDERASSMLSPVKKEPKENKAGNKVKVSILPTLLIVAALLGSGLYKVFSASNEVTNAQFGFSISYIAPNRKPEAHITDEGTVVNENGENNGLIISELSVSDTWEVIGYEGTSETLVIPETIISIPMWRGVFDGSRNENAQNLKTIILPESIDSLEVLTFANLPNLETLVIQGGSVPWGLVNNCPNLKEVYIGSNVRMDNHAAFINANCDFNELVVYCEPNSKPSSWNNNWDVYIWDQGTIPPTRVNTVWGVSY